MRAIGFEERQSHALLKIQTTKDQHAFTKTIIASCVVGADGFNSFLRHALGSKRLYLGFDSVDALIVDFQHNKPDRDILRLTGDCQILNLKRPGHAGRWCGNLGSHCEYLRLPHKSREHLASDEDCWNLLSVWDLGPEDGYLQRKAIYIFEASLADKRHVGRTLLIGGVAHTMPLCLGQGMCSGLRNAFNLS